MSLRKSIGKIHLWLGLSSGLVVFIVAVTGCIYAFQAEIKELTYPFLSVEPQERAVLAPSKISKIAQEAFPEGHLHAILYPTREKSAQAIFFSYGEGNDHYQIAYINPYSGELLQLKDEYADFFRIVLDGHFYLWLPPEIGQPVVASFTLVFLFMVISGLILWWPKKKKNLNQSLKIKWSSRWRRKNYDLHQVLGFYVMTFALVFAVTGLVWGFLWFRDGVYFVASGGDKFVEYYNPVSDSTQTYQGEIPALDAVWMKMNAEYPNADWIEVHPPDFEGAAIAANANPDASTYWKSDYRYFDQNTLEELPVEHFYNRFEEATVAQKIMRMNYDVHVGAIAGLPGKILAFCLSAIIASLPITGFLIWWGRINKEKKSANQIKEKRELTKA
ncbi:PepSY-associated TM helix domain-containing protein [Algoriphagus persicinus]|uniref:PepSY-associated TM helix domain-containing protein n=1 Tax=Algoriphagus persicinus TaxID=3108754 RepID=UPI002B3C52A8|nr:PepSY-associated TM helix domain-containing protein [Algoriphagus sp. E1-3-M2]MEB2783783.1 PepSY-associated TM helix domain-containing protein [Algoriphagus sp. E1-3-M2]